MPSDFKGNAQITDWSVEPTQNGNLLCEIFNEWIKKVVGKFFIQIFIYYFKAV